MTHVNTAVNTSSSAHAPTLRRAAASKYEECISHTDHGTETVVLQVESDSIKNVTEVVYRDGKDTLMGQVAYCILLCNKMWLSRQQLLPDVTTYFSI